MAIEFECPECRATLCVGDESRGKQAQCPQCGKISQLPTEMAPPAAAPASPAASSFPEHIQQMDVSPHLAKGPLLPARIDLGAVITRGWEITTAHYGMTLAASAVFLALSLSTHLAANLIGKLGELAGDPVSLFLLAGVGKFVFDCWLIAGVILFFLKVVRGQATAISDLFAGGTYLWRLLVVHLLVMLIFSTIVLFACGVPALIGYAVTDDVVVEAAGHKKTVAKAPHDANGEEKAKDAQQHSAQGTPAFDWEQELKRHPRKAAAMEWAAIGGLVCFIPLMILGLMFSQVVPLIVDRRMRSTEALRQSVRITRGNKWTLFLLGLFEAVLVLGGFFSFCVGLLFVMPFIFVFSVTAYLAMTSQLPQS